jgi:hypothetical protein
MVLIHVGISFTHTHIQTDRHTDTLTVNTIFFPSWCCINLYNLITVVIESHHLCFQIKWNTIYIVIFIALQRYTMWSLWIEHESISRLQWNRNSNLKENKKTHNTIIVMIHYLIQVYLNKWHCKIFVYVTSQKDIDTETSSIVLSCWLCM